MKTLALLFAFVSALVLAPSPVRADTPISKCWTTVCANPMVGVFLVGMRLDTKDFVGGILPAGAVGYGVQLKNGYLGVGGFLTVSTANAGTPGYVQPTIAFEVMKAGTFGISVHYGKDDTYWLLGFGGSLTSVLNLQAPTTPAKVEVSPEPPTPAPTPTPTPSPTK